MTLSLFEDEKMSKMTFLLFLATPANIFMSSIYTESFFTLFVFSGIFFFQKKEKWKSTLCFVCASLVRSNGFTYSIFFAIEWLLNVWRGFGKRSLFYFTKKSFLQLTFHTCIQIVVIFSPYFLFQSYATLLYCNQKQGKPIWCETSLPSVYQFVQKHYWYRFRFLKKRSLFFT